MATTDEVLKAVQRLTRTYEQLQTEVEGLKHNNNFSVPLYSDGICYWDGYENLATDSELYNNILSFGSVGVKALYGSWNNSFMITLPQGAGFAQPKAGMPDRCFVLKIHLNELEKNKKTIFIKHCNADNQGHGYYSAYLCDKNELRPKKFLGTDNADKGSGDGRSIRFDMFNGASQQTRYHQWITFNFNLDVAQELGCVDSDGYVYIGLTSTVATFYISGWGVANRNTDFVWQNAYTMTYGSLPMSAVPTYNTTNAGGLYISYINRGTVYTGFEIPYDESITGDILLTFLDASDTIFYQANMVLKGNVSGTVFYQDAVHIGNFGRLLYNSLDASNICITSYIIPKEEVELNTVERNGKKYLIFDIPKFMSDRVFYFSGLYTEEYKGI